MPATPRAKPPDPTGDLTYRFVGNRAMILEGGRSIEPGEYITLSEDQVTGVTQLAVTEGHLIDATGVAPQLAQQQADTPPQEGE